MNPIHAAFIKGLGDINNNPSGLFVAKEWFSDLLSVLVEELL